MKIYIGTDHAGFELKGKLIPFLKELGFEIVDKGAFELNNDDDYPDFIKPVALAVAEDEGSAGIIIGGSGQGEAMCANRTKGIRTCEFYGGNLDVIKISRQHNNANILSLGARFINEVEAREAVRIFLDTLFSDEERHIRRINKF